MPVIYIRVTDSLKRRVKAEALARAKRNRSTPRQGDTVRDLIAERLWQLDQLDAPSNNLSAIRPRKARKRK